MQAAQQRLKIVAWLFIVGGILAAINIVAALLSSRISINLGVVGLFIGPGLLRLSEPSLYWAAILAYLGLIFTAVSIPLSLFMPEMIIFLGISGGKMLSLPLFVLSCALFALFYWERRVLKSQEVRQLFT